MTARTFGAFAGLVALTGLGMCLRDRLDQAGDHEPSTISTCASSSWGDHEA